MRSMGSKWGYLAIPRNLDLGERLAVEDPTQYLRDEQILWDEALRICRDDPALPGL